MVAAALLLDPALAGRLEKYRLVRMLPVPDGYTGARRSPRKGGAVEFADYREYATGDEPRRVDWKAYARLGRLYVKEYLDERQDAVLFLIDTSASMDWGPGEEHKGRFALRIAAGLGTCALAGGDRLAAVAGSGPAPEKSASSAGTAAMVAENEKNRPGNTGDDVHEESPGVLDETNTSAPPGETGTFTAAIQAGTGTKETSGRATASGTGKQKNMPVFTPAEGRVSLPRLWKWLGETTFGGGTDLAACLAEGLRVQPGTTSLYVISDLLDPAGVDSMLRLAAGRGLDVTLLHVMAPGELEPPGEGEWALVDSETGERVEVSLTPAALRDYTLRLEKYISDLDACCRRWNARRVLVNSGRKTGDVLLRDLPRAGIIRTAT